jgi:hypothetical protein
MFTQVYINNTDQIRHPSGPIQLVQGVTSWHLRRIPYAWSWRSRDPFQQTD